MRSDGGIMIGQNLVPNNIHVVYLLNCSAMPNKKTITKPDPPATSGYTQRITFPVHNVSPIDQELPAEEFSDWVKTRVLPSIAANKLNLAVYPNGDNTLSPLPNLVLPKRQGPVVTAETTGHGFVDAVYTAYARHRPLILSPDMIWLLICQGFSKHINHDPERYRHYFVGFEGKKQLMVTAETLTDNPQQWETIFKSFRRQIAQCTSPELGERVTARFSGTDTDAQVAFDISLMHAMKAYFHYGIGIVCGIPEITLEGTPEDWQQVEELTLALAQYELDWWIQPLLNVLKAFTSAARGNPDPAFWRGILFHHDTYLPSCGGPGEEKRTITGWINHFFPYRQSGNTLLRRHFDTGQDEGIFVGDYPPGFHSVDINIQNRYLYKARAGFMAFREEGAGKTLRPNIAWTVFNTHQAPDEASATSFEKYWRYRQIKN